MGITGPATYAQWQSRIFAVSWATYFAYYLCRLNMTVASTPLRETFSWSAADLGKVFSSLTLFYAIGQFVNGQLGDRFGARIITSLGILGSIGMNCAVFVLSRYAPPDVGPGGASLTLLICFWGANGFFQAMGWAPLVKVMANWFPLLGRGRVMGWFGTSYQLGAAAAVALATFLTGYYAHELSGDWRMVFLVPSGIFALVGVLFFLFVRDSPADLGVVDPSSTAASEMRIEPRPILHNILATVRDPKLLIIASAFFLLDVNRYGFVNWMPAFLDDSSPSNSSPLLANVEKAIKLVIHPLAGSVGAIVAGWATDRFFGGRRAPVVAILLVGLGIFSFAFVSVDPNDTFWVVSIVAMVGFCTYGPHILMVGHAAQDFGREQGSASAAGFIDCMGYIGATLAGWGAGILIERVGYAVTFQTFGYAAIAGAALISLLWRTRPVATRPHQSIRVGVR